MEFEMLVKTLTNLGRANEKFDALFERDIFYFLSSKHEYPAFEEKYKNDLAALHQELRAIRDAIQEIAYLLLPEE